MNKTYLSFAIILTIILATLATSCREGKKGEPGPSGISAPLLPYKNGSITGLLAGKTHTNDSTFTLPLNFQYFKETSENAFSKLGSNNVYSITRYDSTGNSYMKFDFSLDYYDPSGGRIANNSSTSRTTVLVPRIYNISVTVVSNRKRSTNNMFYFGTTKDIANPANVSAISIGDFSIAGNSTITYNNIEVNSTTGLLSFDYILQLVSTDNSTGNMSTINGNVSFTPYNVVYRQGVE